MYKNLLIASALATGLFLLACSSTEKAKANNGGGNTDAVAQQAESEGPTFAVEDTEGVTHTYDEYKGKSPVVINFWGTWCPPCRAELPDLKRIYAEYYSKGIEFVGLAVRDTPGMVKEFAIRNDMKWPMLMANQEALISFNVTLGIPTTLFIDRNGQEQGRLIGASSYEQFKAEIEKIL
jgi:thiol-disulfide isomerase/thioredoxin